jgi:prepilin-type N-terminal cleavage/methylation domain-containing protein
MSASQVRDVAKRRGRRGFTLMEVMLTLGVLVVIGALTWPVVTNAFSGQRLRAAADRVRAQWVQARVRAMRTDSVQVFLYTPDGRQFRVEARALSEAVVDPSSGLPSGETTSMPEGANCEAVKGELPESVKFVRSETAVDTRAATLDLTPESSSESGQEWSEPILFYPDGTTSTARLLLKNDRGLQIELSLRALTGVVTVGEPVAAEEGLP